MLKNLIAALGLIAILGLASCSKKEELFGPIVTLSESGKDFKIVGHRDTLRQQGSYFIKDSTNWESGADELALYSLVIQDQGGRWWLIRTTPVNKLEAKTYRTTYENTRKLGWFSSQAGLRRNDGYIFQHWIDQSDDFVELTISSIHNGLLSGSFSGKLTKYYFATADQNRVEISNGKFQNIRLETR